MSDWEDVWNGASRATKGQLRDFDRDFVIDFTRNSVRGALPNGNLAPLNLNTATLFSGILPVNHGGTSADLSASGPGVVIQDSLGGPLSVLAALPFATVDWSSGSALDGQPLLYEDTGPTAVFGKIALGNSDIVQGVVSPVNGGTGVANGSGNMLTIPSGGGTAALIDVAQTFSADQTIAADLIFSGTGRRITGDFGNATATNRPSFQSSVTNDTTIVQALPNGSGTTSGFAAYNGNDPANSARIVLTATASAANFNSNFSGTGSAIPLKILISGVESASFNTDQSFSLTKWLEMVEITAPAAPAANGARFFVRDNGAGKTQFCIIYSTGGVRVLDTQP